MNPTATYYFSNAAASISYAAGGYIRLDWQPTPATATELRAIYEHVLRAMLHHGASRLMTLHNNRPPMPQELQSWLATQWIPRAIQEVGYSHCAIVEASNPLSRLAARAVGSSLHLPLAYGYFDSPQAAEAWLLR
ncbi:hypothetical protein GCM10023185_30280 [Hymenobacter saemangeumensis]|uniref:STAS/SEC14 domain-containing protein n=1 Tax=Hymenobacter saemangeumensis TaxID=1084522 RepID=A0ABP8ILG0_9BACT